MSNYVDAEHIRELIAKGSIQCLTNDVSKLANAHLERSFPLRPATSIVDWEIVESKILNWTSASDDDTATWSATTIAGQCKYGLLLYKPEEPCLIGEFEFMIRHLDELVWKAPGCRLLFGVNMNENGEIEFTKGVIEFNGKSELFGAI